MVRPRLQAFQRPTTSRQQSAAFAATGGSNAFRVSGQSFAALSGASRAGKRQQVLSQQFGTFKELKGFNETMPLMNGPDQHMKMQETFYDGVISQQDRTVKDLSQSPKHSAFDRVEVPFYLDSRTNIDIKGSPVRKREYKIQPESISASKHMRQSAQHFLQARDVDIQPFEGTRYDFNGQAPRPELYPVTIWTNADYNDGMIEAANGIALAHNPH